MPSNINGACQLGTLPVQCSCHVIMLFANGVLHVTNCVSPVLNYVRQNVAVVSLLLYSIILCKLCLCRSYGVMYFDSIIRVSNVFRIMFS